MAFIDRVMKCQSFLMRTNFPFVVAAAVVSNAFCIDPKPAAHCSAPAGVRVERFEDGHIIPPDEIGRQLAKSWIVARLDSGAKIVLWDVSLQAREESAVLCGASSSFIFSAVLKGRLAFNDQLTAGEGRTFVWQHTGSSALQVFEFSARDLARSFGNSGRHDLADLLKPAARKQDRLRFWGVLRPTSLNVSMPTNPTLENLRKSYLTQPEVVAARRSATIIGELADNVAKGFLASVIKRDADAVGQFVTPAFFREAAKAGRLQEARREFALMLLDQPWVKSVDPQSLRQTDDTLIYLFQSGGKLFAMELEVFDASVFVSAIEEAKVP